MLNREVEYESLQTAGRMFRGKVVLIEGMRAVVKHDRGVKYSVVFISRLRERPRTFAAHKGRVA